MNNMTLDNNKKLKFQRKFEKYIKQYQNKKDTNKDGKKAKIIKTHSTVGSPFVSLNVPAEKLEEFNKKYAEYIKKGINAHLTEYSTEVAPLCIDIDFRQKSKERKYTKVTKKNVLRHLKKIILSYYDVEDELLDAYIFEKEKPGYDEKQKNYKDGFHIEYPDLPISRMMRYMIITDAMTKGEESNVFKIVKPLNPVNDIYDLAVVEKNGWQMYGSFKWLPKKPKGMKYKLTHVYDSSITEKEVPEFSAELILKLSVRKFINEEALEIKEEVLKSVEYGDKLNDIEDKYDSTKNNKPKQTKIYREYDLHDKSEDNDSESDSDEEEKTGLQRMRKKIGEAEKKVVTEAGELLELLSDYRAESYNEWTFVGWCLYNISNSKEMLGHWLKFSKRGNNYDEGSCLRFWDNSKRSDFTIASLHHWAKSDNLDKYLDYMNHVHSYLIQYVESGTHSDIAKVAYHLYKHQFVCSSMSKNVWYEFRGHRWHKLDAASTFSLKLSNDLTDRIKKINMICCAAASKEKGMTMDTLMQKSTIYVKVIKNLKSATFKKSIIDEASKLFYVEKFEEKLDENRNLLGFENGVYDLKNGKFRAGLPDDYITFSTGYKYTDKYSLKHKYVIAVEEFFKKLQTDPEMHKYILELMSSYCDGNNKQQRFLMFTGFKGSNGKSTAIDFLSLALGDYASTVPHTLLTRKAGGSGQATPELADKRGVRFISINEPSGNDQIHVDIMKLLSGNDKILARALYSDPFYYTPQFKMVLVCNRLPQIPSNDGGTWRRIRVTSWESRFVDLDDTPVGPKEFYKDPELKDKMEKWKRAFIWLLLNKYYPIYKNNGYSIKEPEKVKVKTSKYREDSDVYFEFLNEYYTVYDSKEPEYNKTKLRKDDFYQAFRVWFRSSYNISIPSKKDVVEYLEENNYKIERGFIYGIKERVEDEEYGLE